MIALRSGLICFLSALALAAGLSARTAGAGDGPATALFIIDGSGSMWGRFETSEEKRAKIDVARDLIRPIISSDTRARIGLQSFGHRRRGDCSDVEVIAPPSADRTDVLAALDKLNPRGKGPLAEALRQAAQAVGAERPASVIVIHDGIDNCRQDACAAAAEFAKAAPGVPAHMIGIGVDPSEQGAVQCVSTATGGKHFDVRDPLALAAAIQEATSLALGQGQPAPSAETARQGPQTPEQAAAAAGLAPAALRATLVLSDGGRPLVTPVTWQLFKKDSNSALLTLTAPAIAENIEPGDYTLTAERDGLTASAPVSVEAGKSVTLALSLKAGLLSVKAKVPQGAPLITIKESADGQSAGRTIAMARSESLERLLPPATYIVSLAAGEWRQDKTVKIAEGSEAAAGFEAGAGTLALKAVLQEGGQALTDATFSIQEDDPDSPGGRREVRRSRAPDPRFTLSSGTYYAVARAGLAETRQRIALSAGDALEKTLILPAADVTLSAGIGSAAAPNSSGLVFRITSLDGDQREIVRASGPVFKGLLNAGRYRVAAVLEKHGASATQDIVVEAGKSLNRILRIEAGEVTLKGAPAGAPDVFWEVRDVTGKAVWHATGADPRVLLAPGRYSVRMEQRDKTVEASFALASGEAKTVELGAH